MRTARPRQPVLECILQDPAQSFRYLEHGFTLGGTRWNYHPEYEIQYIVETSGTAVVADSIRDFRPGYVALIGPDLPHDFLSDIPAGTEVPLRSRVIQFGDALLGPLLSLPETGPVRALLADAARGIEFQGEAARGAATIMDAMSVLPPGGGRLLKLIELLETLASAPGRLPLASLNYQAQPDPRANDRVNDAMQYVRDNLSETVRLSAAAEKADMSEAAFSRLFKRNTGHNFVDYVQTIRISEACKQLRLTDLPITEIASQVGFQNLSNFNRAFLRKREITPSQYRRRSLEQSSAPP